MIFFFNDTATTEIYTLSLHDALPISRGHHVADLREPEREEDEQVAGQVHRRGDEDRPPAPAPFVDERATIGHDDRARSEEHTSELQSRLHLVCRLLLEKKKTRQLHTY